MADKILVLGATGHVGKPLVETLVSRGARVKAASRSGQSIGQAEGVRFDYGDKSAIAAALDGVSAAFVLVPTGLLDAFAVLSPLIAAAAQRKVKVVLQTAIGVEADDSIPYRRAELLLEQSGTSFVVLRPNWFADNFHTYWRAGLQQGVIQVPAAQGRSSFIDARDIAASAAAALTTSQFDGRAFTLTGPEGLSYDEAAQILSRVTGRTVRYESIDDETFVLQLTAAGVPEAYARFLDSIFYPVREGWTAKATDAVETLTGKAPRSLETYARDNRALLVA